MTRFSVIIPCFNCSETIDATINSLIAQDHANWEAICVDDGSSDDTMQKLTAYAKHDRRIRAIHQANAGPSRARNAAARLATGKYIAFLDSDDIWTPSKLSSVARSFADNPEIDAVYGRIAFFRSTPDDCSTLSSVRPGIAMLRQFIGENPVCTLSNLTVRRDIFRASGGFDVTMRYAEDLEWLIKAASCGVTISGSTDLHVYYRTSTDGLSADLDAMHAGWRRAVNAALPTVSAEEIGAAEAVHLRYLARRALRTGAGPALALRLAGHGMRIAPEAFLNDRRRGLSTLAGCLLAPAMPVRMRRRLFS